MPDLTADFNMVTSFFGGLFRLFTGNTADAGNGGGSSIFSGFENFLKLLFSWFEPSQQTPTDNNPAQVASSDSPASVDFPWFNGIHPSKMGTLKDEFSATTQTQAVLQREQQALMSLGYNIGGKTADGVFNASTQHALQEFSNDHGGVKLGDMPGKLDASVAQAQKDVKSSASVAQINLQQAYAMRLASQNSNVSFESILKLSAAERTFEPGIMTTQKGRQPGLIQMSPASWLNTVAEYGSKYGLDSLVSQMQVRRDANGHVVSTTVANPQVKQQILDLRNNMRLSALLGVDYAKHNPVQLDVAHSYEGENEVSNQSSLSRFFGKAGNIACDPSQTPWCAAFANSALGASGHAEVNGNRLWAPDFQNYGTQVSADKVKSGDVVVFSWGHVALVDKVYTDSNGRRMFSYIGGNQSNAVNDHTMSVNDSRASFREPPPNEFAVAEARENALARRPPQNNTPSL